MKAIKITAVWCAACIVVNTIWREIETQYPNLETCDFDFDMNEEEVNQYSIGSILPVIIFCKDDKEVSRLVGEKSKKEIIQEMKRIGMNV